MPMDRRILSISVGLYRRICGTSNGGCGSEAVLKVLHKSFQNLQFRNVSAVPEAHGLNTCMLHGVYLPSGCAEDAQTPNACKIIAFKGSFERFWAILRVQVEVFCEQPSV